jgi:hypothetical protein
MRQHCIFILVLNAFLLFRKRQRLHFLTLKNDPIVTSFLTKKINIFVMPKNIKMRTARLSV